MIEGLSGASNWSALAARATEGPAAAPMPQASGWASLGLGQNPTAGTAADVGQPGHWANSWADLSTRMRSVGVELDTLGRNLSADAASPAAMVSNMNQMLQASRHLSEVSIQFQMASGLVTNAATGVNKLLTQQ